MRRFNYFARETLISLRRNLLMTLAGVMTVAISLVLLGGILLFQQWVDHGTARWRNGVEFEVFMKVHATQNQINGVNAVLRRDSKVKRYTYIDHEEALKTFKHAYPNKPDLTGSISASELPVSFRVVPVKPQDTKFLKNRYATNAGVDEVATPDKSIKALLTITDFLRWMFIAISAVLLSSSLFLIMNTIRLATFARRREIEVMKLVGASNWFVRVPFMAEGLTQGVMGAALAVAGVFGLQALLTSVHPSEGFFQGFYITVGDAVTIGAIVLVLGALIGVLGSWIGLRRFLRV